MSKQKKLKYCINCGKMVLVHTKLASNREFHFNFLLCFGPFESCPPPEISEAEWEVALSNAEAELSE